MATVFFLVGAGAGGMTWLTVRAGNDGKWMFGVCAIFFLALAGAVLFPDARPPPKPAATWETRFVSHWFLLSAVLLAAAAIRVSLVVRLLAR